MLPRTHFDLLVNLGEPHRLFPADGATPITFRRASVAGLQQRFLDIESPRSSRLVGAELTPAGARALLRRPPVVTFATLRIRQTAEFLCSRGPDGDSIVAQDQIMA